ncbi:hypothetical protein [Amycolatopsis thermophila]|uniref:Uncharacterized protein n=1 Tax=Amycolatopsis thermophila TaxID=206084 RepID=A0ABU0EMN2_9PSEU|nr:hypothetical protein [Amycolatopsis thermophila]MDQ0376549.1 hypothetical protein [Amycolatopsis thermophila]
MSDTRATLADWPDCETEGCDGKILLRPEGENKRTKCARCEMAGLAPRTELPPLPEPYAAK